MAKIVFYSTALLHPPDLGENWWPREGCPAGTDVVVVVGGLE